MTAPQTIRILSDHVINKIAAGEVVERPASALKEIIENALDAGATHLDIEAVDGGKKLLKVTDNGSGMNRDNALLAIERHATSKIRDVDDIEHVTTLGFRGEALAAIVSVSRFTLTTRPHDSDEGTRIQLSAGKLMDVSPIGAPPGTSIEVRNLFFNVPARRKFLRATTTEQQHIRNLFQIYAIGHTHLHLRLMFDEREIAHLPPATDLLSRVRELHGPALAEALRPVDLRHQGYRLHGLTSLPSFHRADRSEQLIFINGRPASAPVIGYALAQAYQGQLPRGRHPVTYLFIECPPDSVDVNVHPTKKEVRFRNASAVRDLILEAITQALRGKPTPRETPTAPPSSDPAPHRAFVPQPQARDFPDLIFPTRKPAAEPTPEPSQPAETPPAPTTPRKPPAATPPPSPSPPPPTTPPAPTNRPWPNQRYLGMLNDRYAVLETDDGMILLNPQAAHERVLFERFMKELNQPRVTSQGLLHPETVNLPPLRANVVNKLLPDLKAMGFGIEPFGGDTFIVDALPACLGSVPAASLLPDIAAVLEQGGRKTLNQHVLHEHVARIACARAVQNRNRLAPDEIYALLDALAETDMPYTCPHGRPTVVFTSWREVDRKFGKS